MTKSEFLKQLKKDLSTELDSAKVTEHIHFYQAYIQDEVAKGRDEMEVVEELGDPWAIARGIISSSETQETSQESTKNTEDSEEKTGIRFFRNLTLDTWWKKLLAVLVVLGILVIIFSLVSGIYVLLTPVMTPLMIGWFVYRTYRMYKRFKQMR